jgi:hypothetical protein
MTLPKHLEDAAARLNDAAGRIEQARARPTSPENQRDWLGALTDYAYALSDLQRYNNESIHEKLHAVAGRLGVGAALQREPKKTVAVEFDTVARPTPRKRRQPGGAPGRR